MDKRWGRSKDHRKWLTRLLMHLGSVRSLPDVWGYVLVGCRLDWQGDDFPPARWPCSAALWMHLPSLMIVLFASSLNGLLESKEKDLWIRLSLFLFFFFVLSHWARNRQSYMVRSFLKVLLEIFQFTIHILMRIRGLIPLFHWSYLQMLGRTLKESLCRKLMVLRGGNGEVRISLFILDFIIWESVEKKVLQIYNSMMRVELLKLSSILLLSLVRSLAWLFQVSIQSRGFTNGRQVFTLSLLPCLPPKRLVQSCAWIFIGQTFVFNCHWN